MHTVSAERFASRANGAADARIRRLAAAPLGVQSTGPIKGVLEHEKNHADSLTMFGFGSQLWL